MFDRSLVESTAASVLRNGAAFYEWLKAKRQSDPMYSFLFGGDGFEHYQRCLAASPTKADGGASAPPNHTDYNNGRVSGHSRATRSRSFSRSLSSRGRSESRKRYEWVCSRRRARDARKDNDTREPEWGKPNKLARSVASERKERGQDRLHSSRRSVYQNDWSRGAPGAAAERRGKMFAWPDDNAEV
jgi:hypothetical protein